MYIFNELMNCGSIQIILLFLKIETFKHAEFLYLYLTNLLRKAFAKRFGAVQNERGKRKELSPQDAALLIQINFRAYLIRRSKALRALRELAVAKSKLKEIRAQFYNYAYRRRVASDAVERQRFSEKIIVLLLTVDAIEVVISHFSTFFNSHR